MKNQGLIKQEIYIMDKIVFQSEIEKKAVTLLEQCESVHLASITEEGYPRICRMEKVKADSFWELYFTTRTNANKVRHFLTNEKACVYYDYALGNDSVSLMGKIEIIGDETVKKEIWNGKHERRLSSPGIG